MASTLNGTGITYSDGTTTASGSTFGAVGTVAWLWNTQASNILPNSTIAGSSLIYPSTITQVTGSQIYTNGNNGVLANSFYYTNQLQAAYVRFTNGNTGYQVPLGSTAVSGTWRLLTPAGPRQSSYIGCDNTTYSTSNSVLAVRVS